MKKIVLYTLVTLVILSFTACDFLKNADSPDYNSKTLSNKIYELNSTSVSKGKFNIPDAVSEKDQVFVVQVNLGSDYVSQSGTLKNEISEEEESEFNRMFRAADTEEDCHGIVNEVPAFIEQFRKLPKTSDSDKVYYNRQARLADYEDVGDDYVTIYLPKESNLDFTKIPLSNIKNYFYENVAELKHETNYCYVYYIPEIAYLNNGREEEALTFFTDEDFIEIGNAFDRIYKAETSLLGSNKFSNGVEGNLLRSYSDKVAIVVCDLFLDGTEKQNSGTFGLFNNLDFYLDSELSQASNQIEVLYLDSVLNKRYKQTSLSTLTHEFCHLLNFVNKEVVITNNQQAWFTEMLAMNSEELMYSNYIEPGCGNSDRVIKNRIPDFCEGTKYGFTRWAGGDKTYEEYGNTFAYGAFLARNYGGIKLIKEIATNNYVNDIAVEKALKACGYDVSFEDTVRDFALSSVNSVLSSKAPSDIKSLYKDVSGKVDGYSFQGYKIDLSKYGGIKTLANKKVTDVESTGFIVQYAGKGKKSLEITLPKDENLKMYCVVRSVE